MKRFQITEYFVYSDYFADNTEPVTAVLVSDLHNYSYGKHNRKLLNAIDMVDPNIVLCAGDMLVAKRGKSMITAIDFMTALALRYPVYYGNGNHEYRLRINPDEYGSMYEQYESALVKAGVHILVNDKAIVPAGNTFLHVYGFELDRAYYRKFNQLELTRRQMVNKLGEIDERCFNILIAHNPVYGDTYAEWGADLTVSGHLHGGIIRIPGVGGVITPQAKLFPKYDGGLYEIGGKHLAVSRGLGGHTVNIRVFNPAELVVIHLCPPKMAGGQAFQSIQRRKVLKVSGKGKGLLQLLSLRRG